MAVVRVKICGITRPVDALLATSLGASAIGLVFWANSPRAIEPERAREIVQTLPPFVASVGVFVNQPLAEVAAVAQFVGLTAIQLHGDERPQDYAGTGRHVIKAIGVRDAAAEQAAASVPLSASVLLDAHDPVRRGGTGRAIDWSVAAVIARQRPVILSGGLTPDNVADAVREVDPYAVDVSSGVEVSPGHKDPARLRALFGALREL